MEILKDKKGAALIMVMMFMYIMTLTGFTILYMTSANMKTSGIIRQELISAGNATLPFTGPLTNSKPIVAGLVSMMKLPGQSLENPIPMGKGQRLFAPTAADTWGMFFPEKVLLRKTSATVSIQYP